MDIQPPADDAKLIDKYVKRIRTLLILSHKEIVEIGRHLHELRELVPHGEWLKFLAERVGISQSSAHRYISIFKKFEGKSFSENDLANIDANAMFVLGAEDVPDAAVDEALAWIPERSATCLREADLNVLSKLGNQGLEWRLEPEAFPRREVGREDDLLDILVGCPIDIQVAWQPST
jgi:hypothetical protein